MKVFCKFYWRTLKLIGFLEWIVKSRKQQHSLSNEHWELLSGMGFKQRLLVAGLWFDVHLWFQSRLKQQSDVDEAVSKKLSQVEDWNLAGRLCILWAVFDLMYSTGFNWNPKRDFKPSLCASAVLNFESDFLVNSGELQFLRPPSKPSRERQSSA